MSALEDYGPLLLLGAGVIMISVASKKAPRKLPDLSGEKCDPKKDAPLGYECAQAIGGWELAPEIEQFVGYGPYVNRKTVDNTLAILGFEHGDLQHFQNYMSMAYGWELRKDGVVDAESMKALKEAENMSARNEWLPPR